MLPRPKHERWKPLRSGLVNLYRYDSEEFWYEDGHLLLRGNNGTGKSRVLALQLPFLLDGDHSPHRMEPDGDPSKKAEWNLLLGKYPDRLGYTWIEFGRRASDGSECFVTLGCGLNAVEGRGITGKWFFVAELRPGRDFSLLTPQRVPLTKERLADVLGKHGIVYTGVGEYRKAIDATLFQLGERYYPLVNLLIQLRQPQLSRHLDDKKLSDVLSEALPPLSDNIIADVAESFRSLDDDASVLSSLRSAAAGISVFLKEYERYLQIAALRRAADVRSAHTAYETTREKLRAARELVEQMEGRLDVHRTEIGRLELELDSAVAVVRTLSDSPEMQDARALDRVRQRAEELRRQAEDSWTDLKNSRKRRTSFESELKSQKDTEGQSFARVQETAQLVEVQGRTIGVDSGLLATLREIYTEQIGEERVLNSTKRKLEDASALRTRACQRIRDLNDAVAKAQTAHERAREAAARLQADLDRCLEQREAAYLALERETESFILAFRAWTAQLTELQLGDSDAIFDAIREWCQRAEGISPVATAASEAESGANRRFAANLAEIEQSEATELAAISDLQTEQARLIAGAHIPPRPPYTRSPEARKQKPGAPLWSVCDFRETTPAEMKAGLEAALEAAGLLDAWITPDGRLLDAGDHDTVLIAAVNDATDDPRLDSVLAVAIDPADSRTADLNEDIISSILRSVGFGESHHHAWVDGSGRWRLGPLHGAWIKPEPEHIGRSARESARLSRLKQIEDDLAIGRAAVEKLKTERAEVERRQSVASLEARSLPDDSPVRNAIAALAAAAVAADQSRSRLLEAEERVSICKRDFENAAARRELEAVDLGLTNWVDRIGEFEMQLYQFKGALDSFVPTARDHANAFRTRRRLETVVEEALKEEARREEVFRELQRAATVAATERDTLESSRGAAVKDILTRIAAAREREEGIRKDLKKQGEEFNKLLAELAAQKKEAEALDERLNEDAGKREGACRTLHRFAQARLLEIAVPDLEDATGEWSVTRAVEIARTLSSRLDKVDASDAAWNRSEREIHQHVQTLIETLQPHGHRPWYAPEDGVLSVVTLVQGKEWTMAELKRDLDSQIMDRQRILDEREREILERHLIGEVSTHLTDLLHRAEELVGRMNDEIERRPMSTGMSLRFKWEVAEDGPAGLNEIRKLLLRTEGTWSSSDRETLGRFLQQQIKSVRAEYEVGTWADHLKIALDYRRWHRFVVERQQNNRWQRLTRRTHGTGSSGEKAVALTIPQFAAAAAYYQSAHPLAPRLILLDEAFVGIDKNMRSKCMALLTAFDLDFIMTSEHEWGCYPTLPGLAIYHLSARQGIDAIGVTRWIWNGHQRIRSERFVFDSTSASGEESVLQESR